MARRMIGPSTRRARAVRDDRFRRRGTPSHDRLPMGAQLLVRRPCTIPASATRTGVQSIAGPCKISGAVGVAGLSRCGQNIDRQARRRPVIGQDRDKIGLQNGCFPTARLAQPRAANFCWFAAGARISTASETTLLCPATATRLELRRPELCPLRRATPTKICTVGVRLSSQDRRAGGVTFDGREHDGSFAMGAGCSDNRRSPSPGVHVVVDLSALVPQPGNLFVRLCKGIRSP